MSLLDLFKPKSPNPETIVVKEANSKGAGKPRVHITVAHIVRGKVVDSNGYENEIVLFLRKNKKDR